MSQSGHEQAISLSLEELSGGEIDVQAYEEKLKGKLAISGLTVQRYGARLANRGEDIVPKIAKHGDMAPVTPYLPELHSRLKTALAIRDLGERADVSIEGGTDEELIELLAHYEPQYREADKFFDD